MLSLSTTEKVTVVFYVCSRLSETAVVVAGYQYLYTYVDEHLTCLTDFLIKTKVIYLCLNLCITHIL